MRPFAVLLALVLAAVLAFVLWEESDGGASLAPRAIESSDATSAGRLDAPEHAERVDAPSREALAGTAANDATPIVGVGDTAELVVRVRSRWTSEPVGDVPVCLTTQEHRGQVALEAGAVGSLGRAPLTDAQGIAKFSMEPEVQHSVSTSKHCTAPRPGESFSRQFGGNNRSVGPLAAGERTELELYHDDLEGTLRLVVVDAADGRPIEGASVMRGWWIAPADFPHLPDAPRSDHEGRVDYDLCHGALRALTVRAFGYASASVEIDHVVLDSEEPVVVPMTSAAVLHGRISGLEHPELHEIEALWSPPAVGRRVSPEGPSVRARAKLDASGDYRFERLAPDVPIHLRLEAPGDQRTALLAAPVLLEPGEQRRLDVDLEERGSIAGIVVDESGVHRPGVGVRLRPGRRASQLERPSVAATSVVTDGEGRFRFECVPPGSHFVGLARPRDVSREQFVESGTQVVALAPEQHRSGVRIVQEKGVFLRGFLFDPGGEPLEARVVAQSDQGAWRTAESASDGRFELGPLPRGKWMLEAHVHPRSGFVAPSATTVTAPAEGIEIRFLRAGSLAGRVVDAATGESVDAEVKIWTEGDSGLRSKGRSASSFEFSGLPPGRHAVVAEAPGDRIGVLAGIDLDEGASRDDLVVRVAPGALVYAAYAGTEPVDALCVTVAGVLVHSGRGDPLRGRTMLVPPGPVTVEAIGVRDGPGYAERFVLASQELQLAPGERRTVRLR